MDDFGKKIGMLSRSLSRYIHIRIASNICHDLSWANIMIIMYIYENPNNVYQKDLVNNLKVTRSTLSKEMSLLFKKGYLVLESSNDDMRLKKITLTQKALDLALLIKTDSDHTNELLAEGFTDEEKVILDGFFSRIENNIQKNIQIAMESRKEK